MSNGLIHQKTEEARPLPTEVISAVHETSTGAIQRFASETAEKDGLNPYVFDLLVTRESNWKPAAVGDHGLARNVSQFHETTFDWMRKKAGMEQLQYENPDDQLILMGWAMTHQYQNQWGTYQRLDAQDKASLLK